MVGRDVSFTIDKAPAHPGEPVLSVTQLWVDDDRGVTTVADFDLEVHAGEVFGIAGVEGNGQRELVEALMGMRPKRSGGVVIAGRNVTHASPREITELGVGHVPEDRGKHGIVGPFSVADNLVLNRYQRRPFSRRGLRDADAIDRTRRGARARVRRAHARARTSPRRNLSGGNQQKVIIARELTGDVKLLVVAQPTRGLDVGSIEFIHRRIIEIRDRGAAVLLVSAELDEVLTLADRIGVIYRGDAREHRRPGRGHPRQHRPVHGQRPGLLGGRLMGEPVAQPRAARRRRFFAELRESHRAPTAAGARVRDRPRPAGGERRDPHRGRQPARGLLGAARGMFGNPDRIAASLGRSTPFIGAALAVAFAFRAGLFNIGAEGQLLVGATTAAWVGTLLVAGRRARPDRHPDHHRSPARSAARSTAASPACSRPRPAPTR